MRRANLTTGMWNPGQATGGMSPRVHLLRERASIHGSINQVFLELAVLLYICLFAYDGLVSVHCTFLALPSKNLV
jgi:hypothetical protein